MLKILHISDIHIGAKLGFLGNKAGEHRERIWGTLKKTTELAQKEKVDLVVITGDVFDHTNPSPINIQRLEDILQEFTTNSIYVVILPGNHDRLEENSVWHSWEDGNSEFIKVVRPDAGVDVKEYSGAIKVDLPNIKAEVIASPVVLQKTKVSPLAAVCKLLGENSSNSQAKEGGAARTIDAASTAGASETTGAAGQSVTRIALAHGSMVIGGNNLTANSPISKEELEELAKNGVKYLGLGDWHGVLDVSTPYLKAYYAGSLEVLDASQKNSGNVVLVSIDGDNVQATPHKVSELEVETKVIDMSTTAAKDLNAEITQSADKKKLLRVKLAGKVKLEDLKSINTEDLEKHLINMCYFFSLIDDTTTPIEQIDLEKYPQGSIPRSFVEEVRREMEAGKLDKELAEEVIRFGFSLIEEQNK